MPGRTDNQEGYRFGFNGQECDSEVSGTGNTNTALYGSFDTRLGRRWNIDPKPNPSISYYVVFANSPISINDIALDTPKPLTTYRLREMARGVGATGNGVTFNRQVGKMFEDIALKSQDLIENTKRYESKERKLNTFGSSSFVIPDGVRGVEVYRQKPSMSFPFLPWVWEYYDESSFYEVKAVDGVINLTSNNYQIQGELDAVKNSPAGSINRATFTFITTANTIISYDVIKYAHENHITLYQVFAFEETIDNSIRFTPPITLNNGSLNRFLKADLTIPYSLYKMFTPYYLNSGVSPEPPSTKDPEICD